MLILHTKLKNYFILVSRWKAKSIEPKYPRTDAGCRDAWPNTAAYLLELFLCFHPQSNQFAIVHILPRSLTGAFIPFCFLPLDVTIVFNFNFHIFQKQPLANPGAGYQRAPNRRRSSFSSSSRSIIPVMRFDVPRETNMAFSLFRSRSPQFSPADYPVSASVFCESLPPVISNQTDFPTQGVHRIRPRRRACKRMSSSGKDRSHLGN